MSRCNKEFREVPFFVKLHKELNNPTNMHNFGSVDRIMLGLCSDTVARRDEYLTDELTNHLFQVCIFNRLVNDHRLNRLIDSKILADLRIMVDRLQNRNRGFKMTHIEAKSINIRLRYEPKWEILLF